MIDKLLDFSVRHRWLVLIGALALGAVGVYNYQRLPIDAVPDITNVQVQVNSSTPGYSPLEAEQRVTFPIETAMAGMPNVDYTRSLSRYGLSQVTVVFKNGTDIYWARQQVFQRMQEAKAQLPPDIESQMGPISTGLGEIYMWTVDAKPGAKKRTARITRRLIYGDSRLGDQAAVAEHARAWWRSTPSADSKTISRHARSAEARRLRAQFPRRDGSAAKNNATSARAASNGMASNISSVLPARCATRRRFEPSSSQSQKDCPLHQRCRRGRSRAGIAQRRGGSTMATSACSGRRSCSWARMADGLAPGPRADERDRSHPA